MPELTKIYQKKSWLRIKSFSPQLASESAEPNWFRSSEESESRRPWNADEATFDDGRFSKEIFDNWPNWSREWRSNVPSIFRIFFDALVLIVPWVFLFANSVLPFFSNMEEFYWIGPVKAQLVIQKRRSEYLRQGPISKHTNGQTTVQRRTPARSIWTVTANVAAK